MKTKRFCWILLLNLLVLTAVAGPYETVVLKNGSVLEGYISVQHPGKDIIFFAEKATVYIPVKQVKSMLDYDIEIETLSDSWKAWAGDNPLLVKTVRNSKFLQMTDIILAETAENDTIALDLPSFGKRRPRFIQTGMLFPAKCVYWKKEKSSNILILLLIPIIWIGKIYKL